MKTIAEIKALKQYYETDLYLDVRSEQILDQSFIDDTFEVPSVKKPHNLLRSGIGYDVVSAPAEQIVTNNPQAFLISAKKGDREALSRLSREVNDVWIPTVKRQLPNLFKEIVKNKLSRGESYIQLVHNSAWVTGKKDKRGLPVLFLCPEPMAIYGATAEDDCGWLPNVGVPNFVIISYPRQPSEVLERYPHWTNPEKRKLVREGQEKPEQVEWWEYWDKDVRYAEADGQAVLPDLMPNIYGFTPFVRKYSGFGKKSPEGNLSSLIVSDLRMSRDLIREECSVRSDIASILHIFAHKPVTITLPSGEDIDEESLRQSFDLGAYTLNLLNLPEGHKIYWGETVLPSAEVFAHLANIRAEIRERHPFTMAGFPMGASGRQQDLSSIAAKRRYETVVESTEDEVATAVQMALKICRKVPGLVPENLKKADLDIDYQIKVALKASDPVEEDRLATLGSRLYQSQPPIIDLETCLTKYQGKTQAEAEDIITNILVEKVIFGSPEIAELLGLKAAEKAGMADELNLIRQRRLQLEKQTKALSEAPPPSMMQRQMGETQTDEGLEMIDQALSNRGARRPPPRFNRGA